MPFLCFLLFLMGPQQSDDAAFRYYEQRNAERRRLWDRKEFDKAVAVLEEMRRNEEMNRVPALSADVVYNLACGYALIGQKQKALDQLREAIDTGFIAAPMLRNDHDFDSIRESAQFSALIERAKEKSALQWDSYRLPLVLDEPSLPELVKLRRDYKLDELVSGAAGEHEELRRIVKWAHDRFPHSGSAEPSRPDPLTVLKEAAEGRSFRCVEYTTLIVAAANALGLPARALALKTRDVETRPGGAGHVVAEVWLRQFHKWVFADGQWDVVPERRGVPLNAVEFQAAIAREDPQLVCRTSSAPAAIARYPEWIGPYLYYFDYRLDQRLFAQRRDSRIYMLVPKGAKAPTVFQRKYPIGDCTFLSDPELFYRPPGQ